MNRKMVRQPGYGILLVEIKWLAVQEIVDKIELLVFKHQLLFFPAYE